jgi:hypothetical protein
MRPDRPDVPKARRFRIVSKRDLWILGIRIVVMVQPSVRVPGAVHPQWVLPFPPFAGFRDEEHAW